jgi:hypothetical protein
LSPKSRSFVGASGGAKLEGAVAEAVSRENLRWYSSMLDRPRLLDGASDGTELEAVCPGRWRMNSSLLKPPSSVGALEDPASTPTRKAPGRETSWPGVEETSLSPWRPRSLLGGGSDGTELEGTVEDDVCPERTPRKSSMHASTSPP